MNANWLLEIRTKRGERCNYEFANLKDLEEMLDYWSNGDDYIGSVVIAPFSKW